MPYVYVNLSYGKSVLKVKIPSKNFAGVIECRDLPRVPNDLEEIQRAIENPIGTKRLSEITDPNDKVAIVVTDITRRCPDHKIVPVVINELELAGVHNKNITVIVALGIHRPMTSEEIELKIGTKAFKRVRVINHNCYDKKGMVYLGVTKNLETPVWINKVVAEADVKVTTGVVEVHPFAGYSGGGKSIMPGVSGEETIAATHRPEWIDHPQTGLGIIKENPVYTDIVDVARMVGVSFIVNTVLNTYDEIVRVAAGDLVKAQKDLIKTFDRMYKIPVKNPADIVISSSGYPKDINLYQATRAANNFVLVPKPTIKKGGFIIIPAPCQDGVGDPLFYEWMKAAKTPQEVQERAHREYKIGVHKPYIMSKILAYANVIIANSQIPDEIIRDMLMIPAKSVEQALDVALKKLGPESRVLVAPHGFSTLPILT